MTYIRYAKDEDMDTLANIHSKSFQQAFVGIIPDEILKERFSYDRLRGRAYSGIRENVVTSIIFNDDIPVGILTFGKDDNQHRDDSEIDIWTICLLPEYWGQSLGAEFLEWGIIELEKMKYSKVSLWVVEQNQRARRFYEKLGFAHDGEIRVINIGTELKEYRYSRNL